MEDKKALVSALVKFGNELGSVVNETADNELIEKYLEQFNIAKARNNWFDADFLKEALFSWSAMLQESNLISWLNEYELENKNAKKVGVIGAGNLPLVALHDCLCVLISGNILVLKASADDETFLTFILNRLIKFIPEWQGKIEFKPERLNNIEALIATGSDNAAKQFEYYFKHIPRIVRKNRTSVAILNGNETDTDLVGLCKDMFTYFGRGCRSISKILVPQGFEIQRVFENSVGFNFLKDNTKYANNFDYHRAIYLMNRDKFLENDFFILREENDKLHAPVSVYFYQYYSSNDEVDNLLMDLKDELQVVVDNRGGGSVFGENQNPKIDDYADKIDTLKFLSEL